MEASKHALILTMLLSFALSLAFMFWQRKTLEPAATHSAAPSLPVPAPTIQPATTWPADALVAPAQNSAAAASALPPMISTPVESQVAVPVFVHFHNNASLDKLEGSIRNGTSNPIDLVIQVVSPTTQRTEEMQLQLSADEQKTFGPEDGLEIRPHDQLILQSPPFHARIVRVP